VRVRVTLDDGLLGRSQLASNGLSSPDRLRPWHGETTSQYVIVRSCTFLTLHLALKVGPATSAMGNADG
jgi:hypothetical protein